ncbi:MAG: family 78 glycoside hydrolase catalytic domain, partial [Chitinispirillia bacterium]
MNNQSITNLRCEYLDNPLGIDTVSPRLSWEIESERKNVKQTAYQIIAASSIKMLDIDRANLWNSGRVESDKTIHINYTGRKPESFDQVFWKIRIWDQDGQVSEWSSSAFWKMGLLSQEEWGGKWIGLEGEVEYKCLRNTNWIVYPGDHRNHVAEQVTRYYRRSITIPKDRELDRIYFYYTADHGCEAWINGRGLGPRMDHNRIKDYDLTYRMEDGENVLTISGLAPGKATNSGAVTALLEILFKDGSALLIPADEKWKVSDTEIEGWKEPGFDDSSWETAFSLGPVGQPPWGEVRIGENRCLPARYLRKQFTIEKKIKQAFVFYSGLGWSELYINGSKIGNEVLSPALSEYPKRILYLSHDITAELNTGKNLVGVILGNGRFFAPRSVVYAAMPTYGFPKLRMHIRIEYTDNTVDTIVSDESWKITTKGPIVSNNHFDGEEYDARKELTGWTDSSYDDSFWEKAEPAIIPEGILSSQMIEPIRVTDILKPISVNEPKPGVFIFDLGQNITGWCRLKVSGPSGKVVTLRHSEILLPDGTLSLASLRSAKATDIYTLKGEGSEIWEPSFTSHGFRYVEITGFPGKPDIDTVEGIMVNDDIRSTGNFSCSNPLLNQIFKNIIWCVRGNYKTIPLDCPQRDERQGWLGDRAEVMRGESFLFDTIA